MYILLLLFIFYLVKIGFENHANQDSIYVYLLVARICLIVGVCRIRNCFTLYATFPFNENYYVKCCAFCHKDLKNCCVVCVTKQIFRQKR